MLIFDVPEVDAAGRPWRPRHAYLVGKDGLAIPAEISIDNGQLLCRKATDEECALAVQFDAGEAGMLTLQTTLLPDRQEPYLLPLELARHRIMLIFNKIEAWGLSNIPASHQVMLELNEARDLFTTALSFGAHPRTGLLKEQAEYAGRSLTRAINASEKLALDQAERQMRDRVRASRRALEDAEGGTPRPDPLGVPQVGCAVHSERFAEPLQRILVSDFSFITLPMRWAEIEPEEGAFQFKPTDRWVEWAVRTGNLPAVGGPLIDFSPNALPDWISIWEHDYESLRSFAYDFVKRVVTRYRRTVFRWNAVSAINVNESMQLSIDHMLDLTRLTVLMIRKLQPSAKICVEIAQPFGGHETCESRGLSPQVYAEMVVESAIGIDSIGLRLQVGQQNSDRSTRDLMQLSSILDAYSHLDKPIHVTAIGAPSIPPREIGCADETNDPGYWRQDWSAESQVSWLTSAMLIAASKPFVQSVCWQALFDTEPSCEMPGGGLITADGRAKPALKRIGEFNAMLRRFKVPSFDEAEVASPSQSSSASI